jgi:hypothetical protein
MKASQAMNSPLVWLSFTLLVTLISSSVDSIDSEGRQFRTRPQQKNRQRINEKFFKKTHLEEIRENEPYEPLRRLSTKPPIVEKNSQSINEKFSLEDIHENEPEDTSRRLKPTKPPNISVPPLPPKVLPKPPNKVSDPTVIPALAPVENSTQLYPYLPPGSEPISLSPTLSPTKSSPPSSSPSKILVRGGAPDETKPTSGASTVKDPDWFSMLMCISIGISWILL